MADDLVDLMFAGDGEMARLIRSIDWASTSLGPVAKWPQSLLTAVSICLGSRHPIVLWWGPERWMFYNDGYRPMLGERKHPQFLGRPGQECWAEIWDIIGPMMDEVIATGVATWSEDMFLLMLRYGYLEETYFTFSYSPIRDESGRPAGIFNACAESTGRVLADRRMKTLREMSIGARTVEDAVTQCAEVLGRNPRDIPFALIYLSSDGGTLRLVARAGIDEGFHATLPLERVLARKEAETIDDLRKRFDRLPEAPWDEAPSKAMLLPIARPGSDAPEGVIVLAISPRRAFDEAYRGFFELVAGNVANAIANALAHEEERERAEKLAELDRVKTAFFGNVSHELRTPLTLILGPIEDALRDPSRSLAGENLAVVQRNATRLLRLVNTLLDFAKLEASRLQARFEPVDLAALTSGLVATFQSLVESAGLELRVDCADLGEPIWVDRAHFEKIVLNLVSNAFKFTLEGSIHVRLAIEGQNVELSVADTGSGIPEAELPRIFERFHRVEGVKGRSFEGTGIGLALVQELVRQHHGNVRVESTLGKGTTFTVSIPRGKDHLSPEHVAEPAEGTSATRDAFVLEASHWAATTTSTPHERSTEPLAKATTERLLVAEDNADMRDYLVRLLSPRWNVEAVGDGQAALEAARRDPPDLVISDVMMPRLDGVGLLRALRADAATSTIPIVLLSARAGEEAVLDGIETGANDYLVKPFSARELVTRVGTHLEMARLRNRATAVATELAETRAKLLADLDRKNKELEAFSYSVSHDLRAPLRAIDGFGRILQEENADQLDHAGRENLRRVRAAANRMGELIDDLLELSRVERAVLRRGPVDLSALAQRVGERLARSEPERSVELVVEAGLVCDADARLVEIVLENLLGNGWKFTARAAEPRIEVRARDGVFYVKDNGAGFDPAHAGRLFAPFQRLHSATDFPGTGIGLATVQRIIDRHGGRVWAEAQIDRGATVYFTFNGNPPRLPKPAPGL